MWWAGPDLTGSAAGTLNRLMLLLPAVVDRLIPSGLTVFLGTAHRVAFHVRNLVQQRPTTHAREAFRPLEGGCSPGLAGIGAPAIASRISVNPPPTPRALGVDLQHRVVQVNRFGILGEGDVSDGALVEAPEGRSDLGRPEGGVHSVQHGEGRPGED